MLLQPDDYPGVQLIMNDENGDRHGTRCASIVGAANKRDWIVGIAPEARLLIGKLSISGALPKFKYILDGISWAIDKGADIVSVSYFEELDANEAATFQQQLSQLVQGKEILIFACAGNTSIPNKSAEYYPASFTDCVSVGASTLGGQISPITVLNGKTILHAPGDDIESYGPDDKPSPLSGTSFSTPIIAGIAALAVSFLKQKHGGWDSNSLLKKMISTASPINNNPNKKIINITNLFKNL
jgi:subtilisin family serine protease